MPRPAIHPGEILRDELLELGVTPTELSRQIEVPPNRVTEIIHGRRSITGDTALRLGQWFGSSARFWLNLQSAYDLRAAEQRAGKEIERIKRRPADPDAPAAKRDQAQALLAAIFGRKRPDASTDVLNALEAAGRIDPHVEEAFRKAGVGTAKTKPARKTSAKADEKDIVAAVRAATKHAAKKAAKPPAPAKKRYLKAKEPAKPAKRRA
jgi:antitoxin HigA-1